MDLPRQACCGRQIWNSIFQSYGLMAMRTEQHGNAFAKLNNGNLSGCLGAVRDKSRQADAQLGGIASVDTDVATAPND
jgi:hypothetical protein